MDSRSREHRWTSALVHRPILEPGLHLLFGEFARPVIGFEVCSKWDESDVDDSITVLCDEMVYSVLNGITILSDQFALYLCLNSRRDLLSSAVMKETSRIDNQDFFELRVILYEVPDADFEAW
jgi:hypothetical protein